MMMSCDLTLLGLRDQLGTHVEVSAKSGETNSKVGAEQLSGLAIRDQGVVECEWMDREKKDLEGNVNMSSWNRKRNTDVHCHLAF